jgi:DNA-binding winged helix-turn-helix (wHTH) protein
MDESCTANVIAKRSHIAIAPLHSASLWRARRWCDSRWLEVGEAAGENPGKFGGPIVIARFGTYVLDSDRRQLTRDGAERHLTPKAFDLLLMLVADAPRVVRKTELHERLWPGTFVSDATLVSLVKEVRRTLGDRQSHAPFVRTVHGVGYAFAHPVDRSTNHGSVSRWIVAGSRRIALAYGENPIGRSPDSVVCLDATGVSRRHARVLVQEHHALIEDLRSKNGTRVGDEEVTSPRELHDGDRIHIGPILVIYHCSTSGISTETVSRVRSRT